jgi:Tfp pilus assembly protein FimV
VNLKSVCLLLSLCHAGFAAALGLGDISVRSYLGQPLHLVVPLIDATPVTTPDCLSLGSSAGSIAPLLHAQLSIEQLGSQTLLHIRTTQSVSDPVTQFVLISDCEAHLQREYAVLLDPPVRVESAGSQDLPSAATATASAPLASPAAAPAPAPAARRRQAHVRRASSAPARAIATSSSLPATQPVHPAPATRPRLVLSGKHGGVSAPLALRLDTTLSDQSQPRAESLSPTDLSDENTALNRRLAYLEAQLTALQQRNAQLARASREAIPVAVTPPPAKPPTHWLLYLLAIGLLAGAGALVVGLRRRRRPQTVHFGDDTWMQPATRPADAFSATDSASMSPVPQRMPEMAAPPIDVGTELKEDILDQAEVFMAHGHSELAIHLLQEHLRESPTESPVPWLLLLDLLHRAGDTAGYVAASTECRRYFNVNLDGRAFFSEGENGQGLEAYPHLLEQLVHVWNTPDVKAFFEDLVFDHRGGTRIGFEPGAYRDILLLRSIAHDTRPLQKPE